MIMKLLLFYKKKHRIVWTPPWRWPCHHWAFPGHYTEGCRKLSWSMHRWVWPDTQSKKLFGVLWWIAGLLHRISDLIPPYSGCGKSRSFRLVFGIASGCPSSSHYRRICLGLVEVWAAIPRSGWAMRVARSSALPANQAAEEDPSTGATNCLPLLQSFVVRFDMVWLRTLFFSNTVFMCHCFQMFSNTGVEPCLSVWRAPIVGPRWRTSWSKPVTSSSTMEMVSSARGDMEIHDIVDIVIWCYMVCAAYMHNMHGIEVPCKTATICN